MQPQLCSRCKKNVAVVFITRMENGKNINEGLCLKCAKNLGLPQVNEMMQRMGITDEDLDNISNEMMSAFGGAENLEGIVKQRNNEEQEKNTKLSSNNASISYQIATQEQRHSRNLDVIAADEDRLETVRSSINVAETEYAKYEDMITDKKNNLELLSSKESELIEKTKIAESVYDLFRQGGTDDVRDKLIDVMYENQKLKEENITLKKLLEKAYGFMKQFVIDGVNLLERYWESVGKVIGKIR